MHRRLKAVTDFSNTEYTFTDKRCGYLGKQSYFVKLEIKKELSYQFL